MKTAERTVTMREYNRVYHVIERALHPYKQNGQPDKLSLRTTERVLRALGMWPKNDESPG